MKKGKNKEELLTEIENKLNLGYNFVDYFLTIGVNPDVLHNEWLYESDLSELNTKYKEELKPTIINKFPSNDKILVGFDETIILHCFPNGFKVSEFNKQPDYKIYSILLDNNNYSINHPFKYVVCLQFYESLSNYKKLYEKYINDSELNIPRDNDIEENISVKIPASKKNKSSVIEGVEIPLDGRSEMSPEDAKKEIIRLNSKDFNKYKNYYIPKCICLVSLFPYINELSKIIKIIYQYSLVEKQICPLEKIINNLLVEVPVPPKGIYYVEYSLINESIILKASQMNELHTLNIDFGKLFTLFSLNNIIEIFRYLMLNAKIVMFSEEINNLTPVILSLLSLLYPFHYPYTVVSVLHKEAYKLVDNIVPVLVGINEKYNSNFLKENDIDLTDYTLIIDIDKQELIRMGDSGKKPLPQLPSKYKSNLENKINDYIFEIKKNKKKSGRGEHPQSLKKKLRTFFLEFQVELMKDYSKYLNNDIYKQEDEGKTPLENAFKLKDFLNKVPSEYYKFYEYFLSTQMFCDFIFKRMMPKDKNEQIDILYFDEKLLKSKSESIFLNATNYQIKKKYAVPRPTPLSQEEVLYFNNVDVRNKLLLNGIEVTNRKLANINRGYSVYSKKPNYNQIEKPNEIENPENNENDSEYDLDFSKVRERKLTSVYNRTRDENTMSKYQRNQPLFSYYIFPKLDNDYFYQNDFKNYHIDFALYQEVKNIDNELLSKSHLSRIEIKTNELTNYINLIWLKLWIGSFDYQDKKEQKFRFFQMLNILERIHQYEIGVVNNLFTVLIKNQIDDNLLLLVYEKILRNHLIQTNFIFKTIRNIINNKKIKLKLKRFNISEYLKSIKKEIEKELKEAIKSRKFFRKRTIRSRYDTQIIDERVTFSVAENCDDCDKRMNIYEFIKNIKNEVDNDLLLVKCPYCGNTFSPKLKVIFGREGNKNNRLISSTSIVDNIILYSPKALNFNIFDNTKKHYNINIEEFKSSYNPFFWNIIWYFQIRRLPYEFILPYEENILYSFTKVKRQKEENEKKISNNFNIKTCSYITNKKETKIKNWDSISHFFDCIKEIELFIPSQRKSKEKNIQRKITSSSIISKQHSIIYRNDFESDSQLNYGLNKSSKILNSIQIPRKTSITLQKPNIDKKLVNSFNSSISIIKINPIKRNNKNMKRKKGPVESIHSSTNINNQINIFPNSQIIKIFSDNKDEINDINSFKLSNSLRNPNSFRNFVGSY